MQDANIIKELILAGSSEMTVEKFEGLIKTENLFTSEEIRELYKSFKSFLHGGKFTRYAEVIRLHDPSVDSLHTLLVQKEKGKKIEAFFSRKTTREEAPAANPDEPAETKKSKVAAKSAKPDNTLTRFLKKK